MGRLTRFNESGGMWQSYDYDVFGNLTEASTYDGATTTTRTFAVNTATNRLASLVTYDARGNLVARGGVGEAYEYDAFDQMISRNFPAETYLYTADGERVWTLRYLGLESGLEPVTSETFTLRDLDGRLLTTYGLEASNGAETWAWEKDHVYRGTSLLGAATPEAGPRAEHHFTLDHLGSPRVTTDGNGGTVAVHHYWGFGEDLGPSASDPESLQFTGHERDAHGPGTADDLDYMHARHCSPDLMRFLSVDPARSARQTVPQSWNRYAYGLNNPLKFVDPDGREARVYEGGIVMVDGFFGKRIIYWGENATQVAEDYNRTRTAAGIIAAFGIVSGFFGEGEQPDDFQDESADQSDSESGSSRGLTYTEHGEQRRDQARAGDHHRQVGDANRVVREGQRYTDTATGNTVVVKGNRVVVLNKDGEVETVMTNTRRNTRRRVEDGRWVPQRQEEH
ncbi:MAG: RHS repeat-associated core domain-containing protein [Acidobacteriota bacterium]